MVNLQHTVLVVEDEGDLCDLYATWLASTYEVRTAGTLAAARETLDDAVDVVLLDRRLPDGRGEDLLEDVRDNSPACRVAMLTGVEPDFDIIDMGFDAYLVKPVDREGVRSVVDRLLALDTYADKVQTYFALAWKKAALESSKPDSELADSEDYAELCRRLEEIDAEAGTVARSLTDAESIRALFRDVGS